MVPEPSIDNLQRDLLHLLPSLLVSRRSSTRGVPYRTPPMTSYFKRYNDKNVTNDQIDTRSQASNRLERDCVIQKARK